MSDIWFTSDTHFFHAKIIEYCKRPFQSAEEMNEVMIENWNNLVKPHDHVWHLGDVCMNESSGAHNALLRRLNGKKRLVVGNHDKLKSEALHQNFEKIELWRGFHFKDGRPSFTCVHIPLAIGHLRDGDVCVHGHIHTNVLEDPRYINVCVEQTDYKPVHMDDIVARIRKINHN